MDDMEHMSSEVWSDSDQTIIVRSLQVCYSQER